MPLEEKIKTALKDQAFVHMYIVRNVFA